MRRRRDGRGEKGRRSNLLSTLILGLTIEEENVEGSGGDGECGGGGGG